MKMENQIKIFNNPEFGNVRVIMTETREPMFCLADVCAILEIKNPRDTKTTLKQSGVVTADVRSVSSNGVEQTRQMNFINEPNLYKCIFQSRKPEAERFQDWVFSEVLPSIRKHGMYATPITIDNIIDNPEFGIELLNKLKEERRAKELAQKEVKEKTLLLECVNETLIRQAPKVDYYDSVLMSTDTMTTTQVAKSIGHTARWLNTKLRECGIIYFQSGQWMLKRPYDSWNLHKVRTATYTHSDGTTSTSSRTVWNERGRRFIVALNQSGFNVKAAVSLLQGDANAFTA